MDYTTLAGYAVVGHVLAFYFLAFCTWLFYVASISLLSRRSELSNWVWLHAMPIIFVGLVLDFVLQMVVGTIVFFDFPREWLFSPRLQRYRKDPDQTWRRDLACWICRNLLDPFDPRGHHC